jgi:hypothetical protein
MCRFTILWRNNRCVFNKSKITLSCANNNKCTSGVWNGMECKGKIKGQIVKLVLVNVKKDYFVEEK